MLARETPPADAELDLSEYSSTRALVEAIVAEARLAAPDVAEAIDVAARQLAEAEALAAELKAEAAIAPDPWAAREQLVRGLDDQAAARVRLAAVPELVAAARGRLAEARGRLAPFIRDVQRRRSAQLRAEAAAIVELQKPLQRRLADVSRAQHRSGNVDLTLEAEGYRLSPQQVAAPAAPDYGYRARRR